MEELIGVENLNILFRSNFICKEFLEISPFYREALLSLSKATDFKQKSICDEMVVLQHLMSCLTCNGLFG